MKTVARAIWQILTRLVCFQETTGHGDGVTAGTAPNREEKRTNKKERAAGRKSGPAFGKALVVLRRRHKRGVKSIDFVDCQRKRKEKKINNLSSLHVCARMDPSVDRLYKEAKLGMWDGVLERLKSDDRLAAKAAVYARPASGWTLLHQAAFWGNDEACRLLLDAGASPAAMCHAGTRPDQAARRRKHDDLAGWLCGLADAAEASRALHAHEQRHAPTISTGLGAIVLNACSDGMDRLRRLSKSARAPVATTSDTPHAIASCSRRYSEAIEKRAAAHIYIAYGGGLVCVPQGARYYVDTAGDVLVGWHGTCDPPLDMDGVPLV